MTDIEFVKAFEECRISKIEWTHKAHLRMAWYYLKNHSYESALEKIRTGIQKHNLSHGNATGYHETVTRIFTIYIFRALQKANSNLTFEEFYSSNPWLYDGANPFRKKHYSDELWKSEKARNEFVKPDLEPL